MKINRTRAETLAQSLATLLFASALTGCVAERVVPPAPPAPTPQPAPPPPMPAPVPAFANWRDAPQTPGTWTYQAEGNGSVAHFGTPGATLLSMRCDPARRTVTLARPGIAAASIPASVSTSNGTEPLSAAPVSGSTPPMLAIVFDANDRRLDAMAFSRGRFALDINGLPTLYLPAWAEIGRVIEDCR